MRLAGFAVGFLGGTIVGTIAARAVRSPLVFRNPLVFDEPGR